MKAAKSFCSKTKTNSASDRGGAAGPVVGAAPMIDWRFIVEVFVPSAPGATTGAIATGFPIAPDRILTAGHLLKDSQVLPEIRWRLGDRAQWTWRTIERVVWNGDPVGLDAAVLEATLPVEVGDWPSLDDAPPPAHAEWSGLGFAEVGERNELREGIGLTGKVLPSDPTQSLLALGADYAVAVEQHWRGASGSPVVVGNGIVGVIQSCPPDFDARRLFAVPVQSLLKNEEFCAAIGYDHDYRNRVNAHRQRIRSELLSLLRADDCRNLRRCLAEGLQIPLPDADDAKGVAEQLCRALLVERSFDDVCLSLKEAHEALCQAQDAVGARCAERIFRKLIPLLYPRTAVATVQQQIGRHSGKLISAPVGFGVALSAIDCHEADIDATADRALPRYQLPLAVRDGVDQPPEPGRNPSVDQQVAAILAELAEHPYINLAQRARDFAERLRIAEDDPQPLARRLNRELEFHRKRRFFYALEPLARSGDAGRRRQISERLAELVPKLVVVQLTADEDAFNRDQLIERCFISFFQNSGTLPKGAS